MSTVDRTDRKTVPPLVAGERLDRATFHERYEAMPAGARAELIGGVVYMPSPVSADHGRKDGDAGDWLGSYRRFTPGLRKLPNTTVMLDEDSELQPDVMLVIPEELGGQTRVLDGYLVGGPELVVEIGRSTRRIDLGLKKADYERAGVQEYVFVGIEPDEVRWFVRRGDRFEDLPPGEEGVYRSEVFPGLWLDPSAPLAGEMERVYAVLDLGLATAEHAAFVERLREARRGRDEHGRSD